MPSNAGRAPRLGPWTRGAVLVMMLVAALGGNGSAVAAPPPPDNPSDTELRESRRAVDRRAEQVGRLAGELAEAQEELERARAEVALHMEEANKALVDLAAAREAAERAERAARTAAAEARAAETAVDTARADFDRFVAGSYRQGSTIGSIGAYLGADNPRDLLARAQLLGAVGGTHLDALRRLQRARVVESNKDAAARAALAAARDRRADAEAAKAAAEEAKAAAIRARRAQAEETEALAERKRRVEQRLEQARRTVRGLEGQRERYERWQTRHQAATNTASGGAPASAPQAGSVAAASSGSLVEEVVARAMSQLGVPYAWGGGNASGPTYGIRDGGVADSHGDYRKIGFDCSGLMIYAFAEVRALPHYSGYQYHAGRQVPLAQARRGDMLFWGPGRIHHVALYLGDGKMIEAPYSGGHVRIAPVRYDGIMPYATRLIE